MRDTRSRVRGRSRHGLLAGAMLFRGVGAMLFRGVGAGRPQVAHRSLERRHPAFDRRYPIDPVLACRVIHAA